MSARQVTAAHLLLVSCLAVVPISVTGSPMVAPGNPRAAAIEAAAPGPSPAPKTPEAKGPSDLLVKVEVLLDRANVSPGVIDGLPGDNLSQALLMFAKIAGMPADGALTPALFQRLTSGDRSPVIQAYVITAADETGPFLGKTPTNFVAMAKLKHLGYVGPSEELAERFHMSVSLLHALNPQADFGVAGTSLLVALPSSGILGRPVVRIEVDKSANQVRALDAGGHVVATFPATVGSTERPAPSGTWAVRTVVRNPNYTYDPRRLTFGRKGMGVLTIPPGPNNPVGSTWIALTTATYGIHGSPDPNQVGKTASHGCVRLTNWDASTLGRAVKRGTPVVFVGTTTKS